MKFILRTPLTYFLIIIIVVVAVFGDSLYYYLKSLNETDNEYNSIQALMAVISGFVNIITIIFLYVNYIQQNTQNKESTIDSNYNRTITIIYQQLDYSLKRFKPINGNSAYGYYISYVVDLSSNLNWNDIGAIEFKLKRIQKFNTIEHLDTLFKFLKNELSLYESVIIGNGFSKEIQLRLIKLVLWNFDPHLERTVKDFDLLFKKFKEYNGESIKNSEDKVQKQIQNIEQNLNEVLKFINNNF